MRGAPLLLLPPLLLGSTSVGAEPSTRIALRLSPPLASLATTDRGARNLGLGGVGLGVTLQDHLWLEASAHGLLGVETIGSDVNLFAGYALGDAPAPHAWDFSVPLFVGYRHVDRPASLPTDGYPLHEAMNMAAVGGRAMWSRTFDENAVEVGFGASFSVPLTRAESGVFTYYQDGETRCWLDAGVIVGVSFGL